MSLAESSEAEKSAATLSGRIQFLDGVRGVASLLVVVGHCLEAGDLPIEGGQQFINFGRIGVIAFFLVSGYVVGLSLASQTFRTFWIRRFFRLFPIYWLCVCVWVVADWPVWSGRYELDPLTILINVTMVQGFIGVSSILWPTWTLGNELVYYGQQSVARRFFRDSLSVHIGWLWLGLFALLACTTRWTDRDFSSMAPLVLFTASVGLSIYLWNTGQSKAVVPMLVGFCVLVPVLGWVLHGDPTAFPESEWSAQGFNISYLLGGVLFLAFYTFRRRLLPRLLRYLGAISYVLYLVHATVILVLLRSGVTGWHLLLIGVPTALVVSAVLHKLIEEPTQSFGRTLTQRASRPGTRATVDCVPIERAQSK